MSNSATATIPVLHDETFHAKWYMDPQVNSMGNCPNLLGSLEHHGPDTDGSFAICIAGGNVTLVKKELYESIPEQHRPRLETNGALNKVEFTVSGGSQKPLGSTIMPIILTDATTGQKFCIKLHALVMESLLMGMFIGDGGIDFIESSSWGGGTVTYAMSFWNGRKAQVVYRR